MLEGFRRLSFSWYVAQTYPNAENAARRRLGRQFFATHLPIRTVRVARRGEIVEHHGPCFPGYLFILLNISRGEDKWKASTCTRSVLRLLPSSESPIAIPSDYVLGLHEAELDGALVAGVVKPGSRLRVYRGALANRVVECIDSVDGMVRALMDCFGRQTIVRIPVQNVTVL